MDEEQAYKLLKNKLDTIIDKYKSRPLLQYKLKMVADRLLHKPRMDRKMYSRLAHLTTYVDYQCDFKDGRCKNHIHDTRADGRMCCCRNCAEYVGFLDMKFFDHTTLSQEIENELLYYANQYSKLTGFWRKGKGCILPRERRSKTCLTHNCAESLKLEEELLLSLIYSYEKTMKYKRYEPVPRHVKLSYKLLKKIFCDE